MIQGLEEGMMVGVGAVVEELGEGACSEHLSRVMPERFPCEQSRGETLMSFMSFD